MARRSGVAQWQSERLLTVRLWVRVPPPELSQGLALWEQVTRAGQKNDSVSRVRAIAALSDQVEEPARRGAKSTSVAS